MNCHIAEDSTRDCDVSLWGRSWITASQNYLLDGSDLTFFNFALHSLKLWILTTVKAESDVYLCRAGKIANLINFLDIQIKWLLAENVNTSVD